MPHTDPTPRRLTSTLVPLAIAFALLAALVWVGTAWAVHPGTTVFVDGANCPGPGVGTVGDPFCSIGDAITHATPGDTIDVAAGTYDERLVINKQLTIEGAGTGASILQPVGPPPGVGSHGDRADVWLTAGSSGSTIQGFTLDFNGAAGDRPGWGLLIGELGSPAVTGVTIQSNRIEVGVSPGLGGCVTNSCYAITTGRNADISGLSITNNTFVPEGAQTGDVADRAIYINPMNGSVNRTTPANVVSITGNTFQGFASTPIAVEDAALISGNTLTGVANENVTSHGIRVYRIVGGPDPVPDVEFSVSITGNTISGFNFGVSSGLATDDGTQTITVTVTGDTLMNSGVGLNIVGQRSVVTASLNSISGNTTGASNAGAGATLNATENWWGHATGPSGEGTGLGDSITTNVTVDNWCVDAACSATATQNFTLTTATAGSGSGSISTNPSGTLHPEGAEVTLTASAAAGSAFTAWSGHCAGTNAVTTVTMDADKTCTATFDVVPAAPPPAPQPTPTPEPTSEPVDVGGGVVVEVEAEVEVTVSATAETVASTESDQGSVEVTVPAGAFPEGSTLYLAAVADLESVVDQAPPPEGAVLLVGFVIRALDAAGDQIEDEFPAPVTLEFTVNAAFVPEGATEGAIVLAFWSGDAWVEVDATVAIAADGSLVVRATVHHFTLFGVFHQPGRGTLTPEPAASGISLATWGGGPVDLLPAAVSYWVTAEGVLIGFVPGAPEFVNFEFNVLFSDGRIPAGTGMVVVR